MSTEGYVPFVFELFTGGQWDDAIDGAADICPQCDRVAVEFAEGVCVECRDANQAELDRHNAEYDRWRRMTVRERDSAIHWAANHGC